MKSVLVSLAQGSAAASDFASPAKDDLANMNEWLPLEVSGMPPLSRLVLLSDSADHRARTYRAVYGKDQTRRWSVTFDPSGLISEVDVTIE